MKLLYTFKVGKPTFEETSVKKEDGTEVIEKTKVYTPTEIYIKKISNKELDAMDLFYSIQISELQGQGIATNTMILNSYQESGGVNSKNEVAALKKLEEDLNSKRNQFLKESAENIKNDPLLEEVKNLYTQFQDCQNRLSSIFARSAESIAERRTILWACLHQIYLKDGEEYVPVFAGATYNDRLEQYYKIMDDESAEFENAILFKGQAFLSAWFKKELENEEDFQLLESYLDKPDKPDE